MSPTWMRFSKIEMMNLKFLVFIYACLFVSSAHAKTCNAYFVAQEIAQLTPVHRVSAIGVLQKQLTLFFKQSTLHKKAIVVDLDDTIFLSQRRVYELLKDFDLKNQSHYFQNFELRDLDIHNFRDSIESYIHQTISDPTLRDLVAAQVRSHTSDNYMAPGFLKYDDLNIELIAELRKWSQHGVDIIYITGRGPKDFQDSQMYLDLALAPKGYLFVKPQRDIETARFKKSIIQIFRLMQFDILAMIDDQKANLIEVRDIIPLERRFLVRYNDKYIYYSFFPFL